VVLRVRNGYALAGWLGDLHVGKRGAELAAGVAGDGGAVAVALCVAQVPAGLVAQVLADGDDQGPQWRGDTIGVGAAVAIEVGRGVVCGEPGQECDAAGREPGEGFSYW